MAKRAKCDRCQVKWDIKILDQTALKYLKCPRCLGAVTEIRSPCRFTKVEGEPRLK